MGEQWEAEGCPVTTISSRKQVVPHSLMRMLAEHDLLADRLRLYVRRRHPGPVTSFEIGVAMSRSTQIRARKADEPPRIRLRQVRPPEPAS